MSTDPLKHDGEQRTDVYCHECSGVFVALLDYSREGNHKIHCPYCKHVHYRVIRGGVITEDRFSSSFNGAPDIEPRRIWKNPKTGRTMVMPEGTNAASVFLRQRWLEKLQ